MSKARLDNLIKISPPEKEVLREIIHTERENLRVFNLSNKDEQIRYEKLLDRIDKKLILN
jgi:hypothetical protein